MWNSTGSSAFGAGDGVGKRGSAVGGGAERVGVGEREIAEAGLELEQEGRHGPVGGEEVEELGGERVGEPSGPRPARTVSAKKGRPGSSGRYQRRSAGPHAKAAMRLKRSSRGSPTAARPGYNASPSSPIGTLARISGRSSSQNLIHTLNGLARCPGRRSSPPPGARAARRGARSGRPIARPGR